MHASPLRKPYSLSPIDGVAPSILVVRIRCSTGLLWSQGYGRDYNLFLSSDPWGDALFVASLARLNTSAVRAYHRAMIDAPTPILCFARATNGRIQSILARRGFRTRHVEPDGHVRMVGLAHNILLPRHKLP